MRTWTGLSGTCFDVVVVGSGAGGLTAALASAKAGARVIVLEKAHYLGGTSAVSGGMIWIPMNRCMNELGISDTRDDAISYLEAVSGGRTPRSMLETLVDTGTEMLAFVEAEGGLRFETLALFPDYHPEWPGAHPGGRSLEPALFDTTPMGELMESLRPDLRLPFTMGEYEEWRIFTRFPWDDLQQRADRNLVARGRALVAPLVRACADACVVLVTGCPVRRLMITDNAVVGVETADGAEILAAGGVILACGGFEWSAEMVENYLPGPVQGSCSPPHNTGDGIRMAAKIGAKLGNLNEAWWGPMTVVPGDETDGAPTSTLLRFERTGPGSIIVNRAGLRFVNEAHNYNDMTKAFHAFDPGSYTLKNLPAWLIFDHSHLDAYGFLAHRAGQPTPPWLAEAATIEELAATIDVNGTQLRLTVERFNRHAREGVDPDFHRGASAYDRYWGDRLAPHPALGPLDTGPFYAIEVVSGVIGTKGGIVTDATGQAIDAFDDPIPGLYATGNTTAHPMGPGYAGAGSTLGPAMTIGFVAGRHAAGRARSVHAAPAIPATVDLA